MIGLIDVDSNIPNLALRKVSSYFKSLGEEVEFVRENRHYEKIYASAVFTKSKCECEKILQVYEDKVEIGGTGWDIEKKLPQEIEKMNPDYNLYTEEYLLAKLLHKPMTIQKRKDKAKYLSEVGIGFTRRGCPNKCAFCFVPKKEPFQYEDMSLDQIINPKSNKIILLDNNFTEDPNMIEKSKEIIERNLEVDLSQGVNIRIITDDQAYWLSKINHTKQLHIAWDFSKDEKRVINGLKILSRYMSLSKVMCYVLIGFNTTLEEDLYRVYKLQELGVDPYVMTYNNRPDSYYKHLERWCNTYLRKSMRFEDYKPYQKYLDKTQMNFFDLVGNF